MHSLKIMLLSAWAGGRAEKGRGEACQKQPFSRADVSDPVVKCAQFTIVLPTLEPARLIGGKAPREETFKVGEFSDPRRFLQENLHGSAPRFVPALHTQHLAAV